MRKRSKHNLSHYNLLTGAMGYLLPVQCQEVLPGDSFKQDTSIFMRTMPLVAPVMHPVHVSIHSWYVPARLVWENFTDFITGGPDGTDVSEPPFFVSSAKNTKVGELADYLGVPPDTTGLKFSALPFRAYNLIWNEFYRDQDLQQPIDISLADGEDTITPVNLLRAAWQKDYFTLARPFEQKGPAVTVPIEGAQGQITGLTVKPNGSPSFSVPGGSSVLSFNYQTQSPTSVDVQPVSGNAGRHNLSWNDPALKVEGEANFQIGSLNLNDFREAMAIQRFEEKRALYGSEYPDYLAYLGVRSSDARLQRPEYLGGGRRTIQFSEVLQTAQGDDPVGTLRGHGISALKTPTFVRFFEEHGFVITLMLIRPKTIYSQGLPRMFSRETKYDYWQKEYEHIGQQEIKNKELYAKHSKPDDTFGFINRYSEYRTQPSNVHGEFRTVYADWHLARDFSSDPALNADFVSCHPSNRIFAETTDDYDKFLIMAQNNVFARRLISQKGEPI